jgi:hypothetical protein
MLAIKIQINTSLSLLHLFFANVKGYTFSEDNYNGFRQIPKQLNKITSMLTGKKVDS